MTITTNKDYQAGQKWASAKFDNDVDRFSGSDLDEALKGWAEILKSGRLVDQPDTPEDFDDWTDEAKKEFGEGAEAQLEDDLRKAFSSRLQEARKDLGLPDDNDDLLIDDLVDGKYDNARDAIEAKVEYQQERA